MALRGDLNMKHICLVAIVLFVQGCGMLRISPAPATRVEICNGVFFDLLPASKYPRDVIITQIVDILHKQQKRSFLIRMEIDRKENALKLVGMTRFGLKVLEVVWRNGKIRFWKSDQVPDEFSPVYLLADIQLALWPLPLVQQQLTGQHIRFQQLASNPTSRVLGDARGDIISILYYENKKSLSALKLHNMDRKYYIHVDTLSVESL